MGIYGKYNKKHLPVWAAAVFSVLAAAALVVGAGGQRQVVGAAAEAGGLAATAYK